MPAFGINPFRIMSAAAPVVPPPGPLPVEVRVGDDWSFALTITDQNGQPYDLTGLEIANAIPGGATVGAELFGVAIANPAPITGAYGSLQIDDAPNGKVSGVIARALTSYVIPQAPTATTFPVRLSIFIIDTLWRKHTFPPIVLLPLQPSDIAQVPVAPLQFSLSAGTQGPAGPSSSLSADQIATLAGNAQSAAEAYTDQKIGALPPPGLTQAAAQTLIQAALVAYATNDDVEQAVAAATGGFVTANDVSQAIQTFFSAQTFAPTGAALTALIDARIVNYLETTANLVGGAQAIATVRGSLSFDSMLQGIVLATANVTGSLSRTLALSGAVNASASIIGNLSGSVALSGVVPASAIVTGGLTLQLPGNLALSGAVQAAAVVTGAAALSTPLSGSVNASASVQGSASLTTNLSGAVNAGATAIGRASFSNDLAGSVSAGAIATASLSFSNFIGGQSNASATATGFLSRDLPLSGSVQALATASGKITKGNVSPLFAFGFLGASSAPSGSPIFIGDVNAVAVPTGSLTLSTPLQGQSNAAAFPTGSLTKTLALQGNVAAPAIATGALTLSANSNRSPLFAFGLLNAAA